MKPLPSPNASEYPTSAHVPECPVNAIYAEEDLPENLKHFVDLNAKLAKEWPSITKKEPPLPEAEKWSTVTDKLDMVALAQTS